MRLLCLAKLAKGTAKGNLTDSRRYSTYDYISHKYYYIISHISLFTFNIKVISREKIENIRKRHVPSLALYSSAALNPRLF